MATEKWEGFGKTGDWKLSGSRLHPYREILKEEGVGGLRTEWVRNLGEFPKTIERRDRAGLMGRIVSEQCYTDVMPGTPDLEGIQVFLSEEEGGFSTQELALNSAGQVVRSGDFEVESLRRNVRASYRDGILTQVTVHDYLHQSGQPHTTNAYSSVLQPNYSPTGQVESFTCRLDSPVQLHSDPPEVLETGQSIAVNASISNGGILAEQSAKAGEEVSLFGGGISYLLEENPKDGTVDVTIRRTYGGEAPILLKIQKDIADTAALLEQLMTTPDPNQWRKILRAVVLTRS